MRKTVVTLLLMITALTGMAKSGGPDKTVWKNVVTGNSIGDIFKVTKVEISTEKTDVWISLRAPLGVSLGFAPTVVMRADGKEYKIKEVSIAKLGEEFKITSDTTKFVMTFGPIPRSTSSIDIEESGQWYILNVHDGDASQPGLVNTYWRDEATGDWLIGFADKYVVYHNKVQDVVTRKARKDTYELTVADGTVIQVGKPKNGIRKIAIAGSKPVACSMIMGRNLPDYPVKDTTKGFRDNGYRMGDSVTIVGWLKDIPSVVKEHLGSEFSVLKVNWLKDKGETLFTKMDSLGRFTIKIPVINSEEVVLDYCRSSVFTVLEPGETYFYLYDLKMDKQLFMGRNVRMQNEKLAHPLALSNLNPAEMDRSTFKPMEFLAKADSVRNRYMASLDSVVKACPHLSDRYIDYAKGYYKMNVAQKLMQGRFTANYELPQEYMDFVGRNFWQDLPKPVTLYRDYEMFERDYMGQLELGKSSYDWKSCVDNLKDRGILKMTQENVTIVNNYQSAWMMASKKAERAKTDTDRESIWNAFAENRLVKRFAEYFEKHDVFFINMYLYSKSRIDSVGADPNVRDLYLAKKFYQQIYNYRTPLDSATMDFMDQEIKLPVAKAVVREINDKYLAIDRHDISQSPSLRKADDVAGMSDGEKILRKIIEPFKGKIVLLDIWGTWCGPCKERLSHSEEEYERLKNFDMQFLYLCNRSSDESWQNVIKEYNVLGDNVTHYNLPANQQSAVENFLNVQAWPTYKLIDREGNILDVNADPRDLEGLARLIDNLR